jgi:hypothetical protein
MAQEQEHDPLAARMAKAKAKLARRQAQRPAGIRVEPRDDDMRRVMKHPRAGAFRSSGSREWPNDRFTQKRIADGSVKVAAAEEKSVAEDKSRGQERREERRSTAPAS